MELSILNKYQNPFDRIAFPFLRLLFDFFWFIQMKGWHLFFIILPFLRLKLQFINRAKRAKRAGSTHWFSLGGEFQRAGRFADPAVWFYSSPVGNVQGSAERGNR